MAITLADAQENTQTDLDYAVIDQFRRNSWLLDRLTFDDSVNPGTGGSTLTYGYTRLTTARQGNFRAINSEYTANKATRTRQSVELVPLGGSFQIDRVIANLGPAATNETNFQMMELIKGSANGFLQAVVNGDTAVNANGFDGLDKILTGSSTEFVPNSNSGGTFFADWSTAGITTRDQANQALDLLDEFLSLVVGGANVLIGNRQSITRVRSLARWAGYYTRSEDAFGNTVEQYGDVVLIDAGTQVAEATSTEVPVIPIQTRDADGAGSGGNITNLTDLYAVNLGLDSFHAVSTTGPLVNVYMPPMNLPGAVKLGEVEMGPLAVVLKRTTGAAALRNIKVQ